MGAGKEGRHPYPFPFDASEVVRQEPGSVATRLGEQEKTTARGLDRSAGSVARPGGQGESPFTSSFWFFNVF